MAWSKRRHTAVVLAFLIFRKTGLALHRELFLLFKFINFLDMGRLVKVVAWLK